MKAINALRLSKSGLLLVAMLVAALLALATPQAAPAAIGPDTFGYTADTIDFKFKDISTKGTVVLDNLDDAAVSVPIGFTFSFYGTPQTAVFVSTNGVLTFGAGNTFFSNENLTGPVTADLPTIAPLWDDWVTFESADDRVLVRTVGESGERKFIAQWHVIEHFASSPSTVTFQAVLYEGSNAIEYRYLDTDSGDINAFGASATVGIRDTGGHTNGRNVQWSFNQAVIGNGTAIRFCTAEENEDDDDECTDDEDDD